MTYEELQERLNQPIAGDFNNVTIIIQMQRIIYEMHEDINTLKNENFKLAYEIVELKQFIKRSVEPDLRYMG